LTVVCRTDANAPPERGISVIAVRGPAEGIKLERAIDFVGYRAHLQPLFSLTEVRTPADHLIGPPGGGKATVEACFTGTAPIVGIFAVGLIRAAFDYALDFAKSEKRGGALPIISHQSVGYALADAKMAIEATRSLRLRAAQAFDARAPGALELSLHAKVFGSETAVRVISDLMRIVGCTAYGLEAGKGGCSASETRRGCGEVAGCTRPTLA
jgi:nitroalkane oxidase